MTDTALISSGRKCPQVINRASLKFRLKQYRTKPFSFIVMLLVMLAAVFSVGVLVFLIFYVVINGVGSLGTEQFSWEYTTDNVSMLPAIINTLLMTVLTLALSVPVGIFAAVYLVEYAKRGSRLVKLIRLATETLSGIPSIVYGLFGFLMFVIGFRWGNAMLAGVITLALMVLPLIIRTSEEALLAVPDSYREGSFGLGAGRMRTVFRIILPAAIPGIMSGVVLAVGRIVGESAALIYTSGSYAAVPTSPMDSTRTLAVHMYILSTEGLHTDGAFASALVLLALTFLINMLSEIIEHKVNKSKG